MATDSICTFYGTENFLALAEKVTAVYQSRSLVTKPTEPYQLLLISLGCLNEGEGIDSAFTAHEGGQRCVQNL